MHRCYQVKKTNGDYPTERKKRKKEKKTHARIQEFSSGGGPGQPDKKYRSQMANFKEIYIFKVPEGVQHFPGGGGSNFFQGGGGSNCLFPIETHITCDFPGGSGPPVPPLGGSHLYIATLSCINVDG